MKKRQGKNMIISLNEKIKKGICTLSVFVAAAIAIYYLTICGLKGNESALSTVGLEHHVIFTLWGITTYVALASNIAFAFSKTKYKFYIIFLIISAVGMALTLLCDFDYDNYPQYLAHCIGSLAFSSVMGINVFLSFLLTKKYVFAVISAVILITDLIMLLIFKETALIEIVPIFAGYIMLTINNLSKGKEKVGILQ